MIYETVISRTTPKVRRPVEKKQYYLKSSLKKKPIVLSKSRKFTIGRSTRNALPVREGTISTRHASIKWDKSSFKIKDEGSTNGTFVNNKRISGITILKSGDRIRLGKFVLRFGVKKIREKKQDKPKKKSKTRATRKRTTGRRAAKRRVTHKRTVRKSAGKRTSRKRVTRRPASRKRVSRSPVTRISWR